jgi:hypothetical protein
MKDNGPIAKVNTTESVHRGVFITKASATIQERPARGIRRFFQRETRNRKSFREVSL